MFIRDTSGVPIALCTALSWWKQDFLLTLHEREYHWKQCNWWGTSYAWCTRDGKEVVRLQPKWQGKNNVGTVEVEDTLPSEDQLLLMLFGFYRMKVLEMEIAASSATIIAAS